MPLSSVFAVLTQPTVDHAANRGDPEKPELRYGPSADEYGRSKAPRRIYRVIGNRNADQVNEGQAEAYSDWRKAGRCSSVRRAKNDDQKKRRQVFFANSAAVIE